MSGPDALDQPQAAPPGTTPAGPALAGRTRRLLRWYPRDWRARYGPEFTELLIADLAERPRSWRRTADIARAGLLTRLASAGLASAAAGSLPDRQRAGRVALATLACSVAVFLVPGATLWAQLTVGWQWAPPASRQAAVAMTVMSSAMLLFTALAVLAIVPVVVAAAHAARRGGARALRSPALLTVASALILLLGGRHFGNGWPGTGAPWWAGQHVVPGGIAAFAWACTLPVTSYWAHPAALVAFPSAELAWLVLSPAAIAGLVTGIWRLLRRLPLTPALLRYETWLAGVAAAGMGAFLGGAACWVTGTGAGPHGLYRTGTIDGVALALMTLAAATGWLALRQLLAGVRTPAPGAP